MQNGLIPIAYRRDIRHGRILLGAFFLLGQVALVGPIAKRICTNEGFRSIHKLCIHILFLSLSLSLIFTCTPASQHSGVQMPTVLVFLLYNTPTPGRGLACVHACRNACT